jgi:hypothetical protein
MQGTTEIAMKKLFRTDGDEIENKRMIKEFEAEADLLRQFKIYY